MSASEKPTLGKLENRIDRVEGEIYTNAESIKNGRKLLYGIVLPFLLTVVLPASIYLIQLYNKSQVESSAGILREELLQTHENLDVQVETNLRAYQKTMNSKLDTYLKQLSSKQYDIEMSLKTLDYLSFFSSQKTFTFSTWEEVKKKTTSLIEFKDIPGSQAYINEPNFAYIIFLAMEFLVANKDNLAVIDLYEAYEKPISSKPETLLLLINFFFEEILGSRLTSQLSNEKGALYYFSKFAEIAKSYNMPEKIIPLELLVLYDKQKRSDDVIYKISQHIEAMKRMSAYKRAGFLYSLYRWSSPSFFSSSISSIDVLIARKCSEFIQTFRDLLRETFVDDELIRALRSSLLVFKQDKIAIDIYERIMLDLDILNDSSAKNTETNRQENQDDEI